MEIMDHCFAVDELLLNFKLEEEETALFKGYSAASSSSSIESSKSPSALTVSFPEFVEEELEWLSNKDALETCFGILSDNPQLVLKHHISPITMLENTTTSGTVNTNTNNNTSGSSIANCCSTLNFPTTHPVRQRTKRRKPSRIITKNKQESLVSLRVIRNGGNSMGRRCLHCQSDKTPQWRAGPKGPKTLCNACGVRYKSGRLVPEYRPANSPTFSSLLHSNSHRKVVEMRRQKQIMAGEVV